jgi:hypothetical protein
VTSHQKTKTPITTNAPRTISHIFFTPVTRGAAQFAVISATRARLSQGSGQGIVPAQNSTLEGVGRSI